MRKSKKNLVKKNKKNKTQKKCVYTDETRRVMKFIRYFKKNTRKNKINKTLKIKSKI